MGRTGDLCEIEGREDGGTGCAHPGPQVRWLQQLQVQCEARSRVWVGLRPKKTRKLVGFSVLHEQTGDPLFSDAVLPQNMPRRSDDVIIGWRQEFHITMTTCLKDPMLVRICRRLVFYATECDTAAWKRRTLLLCALRQPLIALLHLHTQLPDLVITMSLNNMSQQAETWTKARHLAAAERRRRGARCSSAGYWTAHGNLT